MFYMCLFDVKITENDLKKVETCRNVNELYVKVQFNTAGFVGIAYLIVHKPRI